MPDEALQMGGSGMQACPILLERPDVVRQILDPQFDLSFVQSLGLCKLCSQTGISAGPWAGLVTPFRSTFAT